MDPGFHRGDFKARMRVVQFGERIEVMNAVGINVRRIDGADKVSGQATYAGDLRLPGLVIAKVLRSSLPHARIRAIDTSKASALPGVLAVLTRDTINVASNSFGAYVRRPTDHCDGQSSLRWRYGRRRGRGRCCHSAGSSEFVRSRL